MPWNILGTLVSTRQISLVSMTNQMLTNDDKRTNKKSDTGKLAHERRSWKNWIGTCHPPCIKIEVDGEGLLVPFFTRHKASRKRSISEIQKFVGWNKARERRTPESIETAKVLLRQTHFPCKTELLEPTCSANLNRILQNTALQLRSPVHF